MTTTPTAPPADLLSLFAPLTPSDLTAAWGHRPLLARGASERFAGLIDEPRFRAALATGLPRTAVLEPADPDEPLTAGSTRVVAPDRIDEEMAAGRTVCVTDLSAGDPGLAALARQLRGQLGALGAVRVNAFLSPPGSGADLHIDARVTISLQVAGRKEWWHGDRPTVVWPRSNAQLLPTGEPVWMFPWCGGEDWERLSPVRREDLTHVVLEPGDLLCLPAGTWHAARALERSLALNLSVSPAHPAQVLADLLDPVLAADPLWRGGPGLAPRGHDAVRRRDLGRLRDLVAAHLHDVEP